MLVEFLMMTTKLKNVISHCLFRPFSQFNTKVEHFTKQVFIKLASRHNKKQEQALCSLTSSTSMPPLRLTHV